MTATYLDDEVYERRRRRKIAALTTAGAALVVATDVSVAMQWAAGARSATDAITTLLITAAAVVAATWQFTHRPRSTCPGYPVGAYMVGAATCRDGLTDTTHPADEQSPTNDEGEHR